jgi:molybdenum ABC transporter molybdate-binding protein
VKKLIFLILAVAAAIGVLFWFHRGGGAVSGPAQGETLVVYCAAGLKKPVEAIAAAYQQEQKVQVQLQYGGSGTLLSQIRVGRRGDLLIAADDGTVNDARSHDVIREVLPVAVQTPVIAVRAGNPKGVRSFADLRRDEVRVALANPEAASIGKVTRAAAGPQWEALARKAAVMKPTVNEIASDLSLGTVDAAVIWDSTARQFNGLEAVHVPELDAKPERASATVLAVSTQPTSALRFARYLSAPEKGGAIFEQHGFKPAGGDQWAVKPAMVLYSGGVNRPAVESLLRDFSNREGVDLTTVFNGCGILCASMKAMQEQIAAKMPDAYFACDVCFVPPVAALFPEAVILTETEIGVAVRKENPHGIKTLADLGRPGLRVGLCNAEQSTLGYMTRGILKDSGLHEAIRKNVVVEVPTADFLINQMRAGGLDAAIVYKVNVAPQAEALTFFTIQHPGAKAMQPFAVRTGSPNAQLAGRLLAFMRAHRDAFEGAGFAWREEQPTLKSAEIEVPPWLKEK